MSAQNKKAKSTNGKFLFPKFNLTNSLVLVSLRTLQIYLLHFPFLENYNQ